MMIKFSFGGLIAFRRKLTLMGVRLEHTTASNQNMAANSEENVENVRIVYKLPEVLQRIEDNASLRISTVHEKIDNKIDNFKVALEAKIDSLRYTQSYWRNVFWACAGFVAKIVYDLYFSGKSSKDDSVMNELHTLEKMIQENKTKDDPVMNELRHLEKIITDNNSKRSTSDEIDY